MNQETKHRIHRLPTIEQLYATAGGDIQYWLRELCVQLRAQNEILAQVSEELNRIYHAIGVYGVKDE